MRAPCMRMRACGVRLWPWGQRDVEDEEVRVLHKLEFTALTLAWMTFWGGLFFYLGHDRPGAIRYLF